MNYKSNRNRWLTLEKIMKFNIIYILFYNTLYM